MSPDFELLYRGCAERIGCTQQHGFAIGAYRLSEFADGGGFAGSIYAHNQNDFWNSLRPLDRRGIRASQNSQQFGFEQALEFFNIFDLLAVGAFTKFLEYLMSGRRS